MRQVLFKMLNSGFLGEIYGCISTGKEANVYHATGAGGADLAVKVYKTSILAFKDRDRRARRTCCTFLYAIMCEHCYRHASWWSLLQIARPMCFRACCCAGM